MLRSLTIGPGASPEWVAGEAAILPPEPGARLWIDVVDPSQPELDLLRSRFDLHPVAIDSCLRVDQRPKLEEYHDSGQRPPRGRGHPGTARGGEGVARTRLGLRLLLICERLAHTNFDALDVLFDAVESIEDSALKQDDDDAFAPCCR